MTELADIDDVGGVVGLHDGIELAGGDAVEDGAHEALGSADGALIGVAGKRAFEQEEIGIVHQRALEAAVELALDRRERIMQRAAMRSVDADGVLRAATQAEECAGLGPMAVQNVRIETADRAHELRPGHKVERTGFPSDCNTIDAELHARCNLGQCLIGTFAAGQAVGDDPDMVAALGLTIGEVEDVPNDSADRRARRVQDTKRLTFHHGHHQNQRSPTSTVSPGPIGVPGGTTKRAVPPASVCVTVTRSRKARGVKPPAMATALSTVIFGT